MCGICGTDVHILRGSFPAPNLPLIPGHEFSGHVVEASVADHVKTGDYVTADINLACGHCYFCRRQQKLFCEQIRQIGVHTHGALAEFVKAPASAIYQVPDELSPQQSAYIEPSRRAVHGQERAEIRREAASPSSGPGPWAWPISSSPSSKAAPVIITEMNQVRLQKARDMGADYAIDAGAEDAVAAVKAVTDGRGVDYVIEAVGSIPTYRQALTWFAAVEHSSPMARHRAPHRLISNRSISTARSSRSSAPMPAPMRPLAGGHRTDSGGRFNPEDIITEIVPLDDVVGAIETVEKNKDVIKIQIRP